MNKGKGNRQQKKKDKGQEKERRTEKEGKTRTRFGNQSKIRETNKIPGKTQRLPGISIEI